ncbi:DUF6632 domain-containing protein [Microbulbifer sp. 2205BS26-8]|uniref:DUF6632 domain-containing protein n=1 Tax=Microbulbifer sp. 2205BS26-8 TaxID=3064386 RepID=UPI00273F4813|nr:DUF6632 domain-containing protein [Microbulbifer sp. 2205BS26-8]MDP5211054.1 hypothetical protein [Microbulbifer sp. 2205BS26-8]
MDDITRAKYLPIALIAIGMIFIFAMYPMMAWIWPAGWGLTPPQPEHEKVIAVFFAVLGVFLILAARNPTANIDLIWLTIWLNLVNATIVLLTVLADWAELANLIGNIPVQYFIAWVLWYLLPRNKKHSFLAY